MKLWFTIMAGPGSLTDLVELWDPIKAHFTGMCAAYFGDRADEEAQYLELNKGEGLIIYLPYVGRHDLARNVALHCGKIQQGDWVMQADTLERPQPWFLTTLAPRLMAEGRVNCCLYYGKPYLYQYHESITFRGTPHEGWFRQDEQAQIIELAQAWPDETKIRANVRPLKRRVSHFILHYLRYYVEQPWGANHMILGLDKNGDPNKLFPPREARRLAFRDLCRKMAIPLTAEAVKTYMQDNKHAYPDDFKQFVRDEKILNDVYRFYVLGKDDFIDDHDHKNMVEIP